MRLQGSIDISQIKHRWKGQWNESEIYYLNDVDGGSTEFKFNPSAIEPKEGMLLIAPAHWTHMHKGNPPTGEQTKYIITGWLEKRECGISDEFQEDYYI